VSRDVRYAAADTVTLRMDVYRPSSGNAPRPALVFYTAGSWRANTGYTSWARVAASKGLVAILADLRPAAAAQDFRTLLTHLTERAADYGLDTAAVAVFGASNNAYNVFPIAQDPRETRIKAVVMYYAGSDVMHLRRDLPVLYVRAGLDRPFVNAHIDSVVGRALAQNAPITVINYAGGHHGFETTDDNTVTREVIDETVDFVKRVTAPQYRAALASRVGYATAAAQMLAGNFAAAAPTYAELVAREPNDARLRLSYGEALLGDRQFAKACDEFATLKGKGLGPRDLGLPAARACLQKGDADAAMAWLASIPKRFLPLRVKDEPVFAPLKGRADFKALFEP
jgi:dienelactone hydrolase